MRQSMHTLVELLAPEEMEIPETWFQAYEVNLYRFIWWGQYSAVKWRCSCSWEWCEARRPKLEKGPVKKQDRRVSVAQPVDPAVPVGSSCFKSRLGGRSSRSCTGCTCCSIKGETQRKRLRKRRETLGLETGMAVSDARLPVLAASDAQSDGLASYQRRGAKGEHSQS